MKYTQLILLGSDTEILGTYKGVYTVGEHSVMEIILSGDKSYFIVFLVVDGREVRHEVNRNYVIVAVRE